MMQKQKMQVQKANAKDDTYMVLADNMSYSGWFHLERANGHYKTVVYLTLRLR